MPLPQQQLVSPRPKQKVILYDLEARGNASSPRLFSPNTWRTLLALKIKGVPYEHRRLSFLEIRGDLAKKTGRKDVTVPTLEVSAFGGLQSWYIVGSANIADWLERANPDTPSLYGGPEGRAYAQFMENVLDGFRGLNGSYFPLWIPDICKAQDDENKVYFREKKLGADKFDEVASRDVDALIARAIEGLKPFEDALAKRPGEFLQGPNIGYSDCLLFAFFAMGYALDKEKAKKVWLSGERGRWAKKILGLWDGWAKALLE